MRRGRRKATATTPCFDYSACMVAVCACRRGRRGAGRRAVGVSASAAGFDLIVRGGIGVRRHGRARRSGSTSAIKGDRIAAFGDLSGQQAGREIDATGPCRGARLHRRAGTVRHDAAGRRQRREPSAPGHHDRNHRRGRIAGVLDAAVGRRQRAHAAWHHGGLDRIRRVFPARCSERGIAINLGTLVPATMVRAADRRPRQPRPDRRGADADGSDGRSGDARRRVRPVERADLSARLVREDGELIALARVAARHNGIYVVTHPRRELQSVQGARRSARDRARGQASGRHLSSEGRRAQQLGPHGRSDRRS